MNEATVLRYQDKPKFGRGERNQVIQTDLQTLLPRQEGTAEAGRSGGRTAVRPSGLGTTNGLGLRISGV